MLAPRAMVVISSSAAFPLRTTRPGSGPLRPDDHLDLGLGPARVVRTSATVDPGCTCPCGYCTGQVAGGHEKCPYRCGRKRMEATTSHPTGAGPGRPVPSFRPHPAAKLGASVPAGALSGGGA